MAKVQGEDSFSARLSAEESIFSLEIDSRDNNLVIDQSSAEAGAYEISLTVVNEFNLTTSIDFSLTLRE